MNVAPFWPTISKLFYSNSSMYNITTLRVGQITVLKLNWHEKSLTEEIMSSRFTEVGLERKCLRHALRNNAH
jgi:hypothetical protein